MSNKTQLLNHNERLASVIQTLQGKSVPGGSSSGGSVETCTVTIASPHDLRAQATVYENGVITPSEIFSVWQEDMIIENVVKGSIVIIRVAALETSSVTLTNATYNEMIMTDDFGTSCVFTAKAG